MNFLQNPKIKQTNSRPILKSFKFNFNIDLSQFKFDGEDLTQTELLETNLNKSGPDNSDSEIQESSKTPLVN